jgi:hypothetical protein
MKLNSVPEDGMVSCPIHLLFRMALMKQVGLKLNETYQLLVSGEDVNLLGKNIL